MKRFIDRHYVTCAEYQVFLNDILKQGKSINCQPYHWDDHRFPTGFANKPVLGMSFNDARFFCSWLTKRQNEFGVEYRLPSPKEALSIGNDGNVGCWCQVSDSFSIEGINSIHKDTWEYILHKKLLDDCDYCIETFGDNREIKGIASIKFGKIDQFLKRTLKDFLTILSFEIKDIYAFALARDVNFWDIQSQNFDIRYALDHIQDLESNDNAVFRRALKRSGVHKPNIPNSYIRESIENIHDYLQANAFFVGALSRKSTEAIIERTLAIKRTLEYTNKIYSKVDPSPSKEDRELLNKIDHSDNNPEKGACYSCIKLAGLYTTLMMESKSDPIISKLEERRNAIMKIYLFFSIINARRLGDLPAWEGIRIVRELDISAHTPD